MKRKNNPNKYGVKQRKSSVTLCLFEIMYDLMDFQI